MKLTQGNPNVMNLSDLNRPDKLAEQFSELYDNQWTDCYQPLTEKLNKTETESIQVLLHIVQIVYTICLEQSQTITNAVKVNLLAFAGMLDGGMPYTIAVGGPSSCHLVRLPANENGMPYTIAVGGPSSCHLVRLPANENGMPYTIAEGGPWSCHLVRLLANENSRTQERPRETAGCVSIPDDRPTRQNGPRQEIYTIEDQNINFNLRDGALRQLLREKDEEIVRLKENCNQLRTRNDAQQKILKEKDEEILMLKDNCMQLRTRNDALQQLQMIQMKKDEEIVSLKEESNQLRTRLSEIAAMQLTAGNPNITDLSDPNRPDKLAEQFSELYDNLWTDCFQTLVDYLEKTEEDAVQILLTIIKTAYDMSLERSQNITKAAKEALETLVGKSDEEPEKACDTLIQETLHKLKSYRTKNFRTAPKDIAMIIEEKLLKQIGEPLITTCRIYIEECVRISWLMCIKDPPMYIFCEKEDVFDKKRFVEYTKSGHAVSYVVWPVLYLHYNGPLMRKGVAQGV